MLSPIEDMNAPQFRCVYLPNIKYTGSEEQCMVGFMFNFNHGLIDGMSTIAAVRKFQQLLNSAMKGEDLNIQPWPCIHPPLNYFFQRAIDKLHLQEGIFILNHFTDQAPDSFENKIILRYYLSI